MQPRRPLSIVHLAGRALIGLGVAIAPQPVSAQNVIVVIADDVSAEWFTAYDEQSGNPPTPTIDSLATEGVRFRSAWAYPVCSPFRASVYTGRHPAEHGIGHGINSHDDTRDYVLDPNLPNLGNLLGAAGYRTAASGKWHMAAELGFSSLDFYDGVVSITEGHPNLAGMQRFSGLLFGGLDYFNWPKTVDGVTSYTTLYATTDTADAAIDALAGSEPFLLWVAFNAPHAPAHDPPPELLADPSVYSDEVTDQYRSMIEAMDTELGRFLQQVDLSDTTLIFVADNGTPRGNQQPPRLSTHAKATVYEGGVRVPLIVAGQAVAPGARGREARALVQATDLFPTILELGGLDPPERPDAISILPYLSDPELPSLRQTAYTEMFTPNGGPIDPEAHNRAARGSRYKLIRNGTEADELYDLQIDPFELSRLGLSALTPEQQIAYGVLDLAILTRASACANGLDDDGDGLVDAASDPGCDASGDTSERSDALACDDGFDNDGDGRVDFSPVAGGGDPGCYDPSWALENPHCQDGVNNDPDQDSFIDFDGGAAAGLPPEQLTDPDPQCAGAPWRDQEAVLPPGIGCGIGPELSLLGLWLVARRTARRRCARWFRG